MKTIGFIGLGIMGKRMAANLLTAGYSLIVHNRTKDRASDLLKNGAHWADSPKELASKSDIIITMLSTPDVVKEFAIGKKGFLSSLTDNNLWVNCSTVNPSFAEEMQNISQDHHIRYVDAPVVGTKNPAEKGELLFLVGGDPASIKEANPLFDIMGKKTIQLGKAGSGSSMKILINQLLGQSIIAFAEAMTLGNALGLEKETLLNVLTNTPVVPSIISMLRPKLENENYEANFPLKWMHKDLQLSSQTAYDHDIATPNLHSCKELFAQAKQQGYADLDFSAIYKFIHQ